MKDLKQKTLRGGVARLCAQAANFVIRLGSLMILARLLGPKDFGLVGMVTAFTGVLTLLRDFGLSSAAVQRATVTEEQVSTLFWINVLVGLILGLSLAALAPALAAFYHEPRLVWVTIVLALAFIFNAAGVQHSAMLMRELRFTALAVINTISLLISSTIAIAGAKMGYGYWALVAMTVSFPLGSTIGFWLVTDWIPGRPHKQVGMRSMMRFGGTITLNGVVAYIAYNAEKVLIGRYWGADAIGLYGRAYQIVNIPTENLNTAIGEVAFSALSRLQNDAERFKRYFLKGYTLVLTLTIPITVICILFAKDVTLVVLGPKWLEAVPVFRLLGPTILAFALINPVGWLLCSLGLVGRSLRIALVFAPTIIAGYFVGLPYGPTGVALAYSTVMAIWVVPLIAWSIHGTPVSGRDILSAVSHPFASTVVAAIITVVVRILYLQKLSPLVLLASETVILITVFVVTLLFVAGQKAFYIDLLRSLKPASSPAEEESLIST
jgi:O-antigen/teichoic acid export membrane protein